MKPLIVGESNPYSGDPEDAMLPYPDRSSGARLCYQILGMLGRDYLDGFDRANLCGREWDADAASLAAAGIRHDRVILLGTRVCRAFGVPYRPFEVRDLSLSPRRRALVLSHPSGLNRAWNDPATAWRVREAVRLFAPELSSVIGGTR